MLAQVVIQNFQSLESAVLDLAPLTVFVGKGDSGKSAILRALRAALFNDGGDEYVRHGTDQATVALAFADGNILIWDKPRGKGASYNLNGQSFTKLAGQVPEEIVAATGFREIEIDSGTTISPQIHDQFDQPFVMFESGSKIARILGSLTKLNAVVQAQLICKKNGNVWATSVNQNATEQERLMEQRSAMPDVDWMSTVTDTLAQDLDILEEAQRSLDQASSLIREYGSLSEYARYDLASEHEDLEAAKVLLDKAERARSVVGSLHSLRKATAERLKGIEAAQRDWQSENEKYVGMCAVEGVCDTCPFAQ